MNFLKYRVVVVGAGISGITIAERITGILNLPVLVLEKRNHIGGNCYDGYTKEGLLVSKYGPHIFRTGDKRVWDYIRKFSGWRKYEHRVVASVNGKLVPVPVNINTINQLFGEKLEDEAEMKEWIDKRREKIDKIENAEQQVLGQVGRDIYELLFEGYTKKQWGREPRLLDPSITARIPVRFNKDDRYFDSEYQYQPIGGFTKLFKKMLANKLIEVKLNTDFFEVSDRLNQEAIIIYTGAVDDFYRYKFNTGDKLEYRSLSFRMWVFDKIKFQKFPVINYPDETVPYTRVTEYKQITGQRHPMTAVVYEYPAGDGEPYYPIIDNGNKKILEVMTDRLKKEKNIYFLGRLGKYKYINMDVAVKEALELFELLSEKGILGTSSD